MVFNPLSFLPKNVLEKGTLWLHFIFVSILIHLFFVLFLFVEFRNKNAVISLTLIFNQQQRGHEVLFTGMIPISAKKESIVTSRLNSGVTMQSQKREEKPNTKKTEQNKLQKQEKTEKAKEQKKEQAPKKSMNVPQKLTKPVTDNKKPVISPQAVELSSQIVQEKRFQDFYQEIIDHWNVPFGIITKNPCKIKADIDDKGKIKRIDVIESSGIVVYDIAAQSVLYEITMPKWTWGKTLQITFNQ